MGIDSKVLFARNVSALQHKSFVSALFEHHILAGGNFSLHASRGNKWSGAQMWSEESSERFCWHLVAGIKVFWRVRLEKFCKEKNYAVWGSDPRGGGGRGVLSLRQLIKLSGGDRNNNIVLILGQNVWSIPNTFVYVFTLSTTIGIIWLMIIFKLN